MFKHFKFVNIICIILVISVLSLAVAIGFVAVKAMRENSYSDPLEGFDNETQKKETKKNKEESQNLLPYRVRSDMSVDSVYLRSESYGNYDGKTWLPATPYKELIDGKYPATYLGTKQIEKWKLATPIALEIDPNNSVKVVPHYTATALLGTPYNEEYDIPIDDVTANEKSSEYYRMFYYDYKDTSLKPSVTILEYEKYEANYREFVYNQYLTIDQDIKSYMLNIANEQKFDKNDEELAEKISKYVMGIGEYAIEYNTELDKAENVAIAFIEDYKQGTCKHFATVATLLFRALDIPARYVVGYMTETTQGEWVQVTNFDAHAWVEVYVDGFGWKNVEVTPPRLDTNVIVKPIDVNKFFDGTPLYPEQVVKGLEAFEEKGYTYEVVISGERTDPGVSESKIESIKIFDAQGKDVTAAFVITYGVGKIQVYGGIISLESEDFDFKYVGVAPTSKVELCKAVWMGEGEFNPEYSIEIKAKELSSEIGSNPHAFEVVITDASGQDVTNHYKYEYNFGSVNVSESQIIFNVGSASKVFDNQELVCNDVEIIIDCEDVLEENIRYEVVGSQTAPGFSPNTIDISSIVVLDKDGNDITSKFILVVNDGTLTVYLEE